MAAELRKATRGTPLEPFLDVCPSELSCAKPVGPVFVIRKNHWPLEAAPATNDVESDNVGIPLELVMDVKNVFMQLMGRSRQVARPSARGMSDGDCYRPSLLAGDVRIGRPSAGTALPMPHVAGRTPRSSLSGAVAPWCSAGAPLRPPRSSYGGGIVPHARSAADVAALSLSMRALAL